MSTFSMNQRARQTGAGMIFRGLVVSLCLTSAATAQQPPPKAVPVEEETDPGPAPAPQVRKAVPVPDAAPEPSPPKGKPVPAPAPRGPAAPKSPEDDLFDYCELLYSKTNYGLALQQYEQYLNLYAAGKHREEAIFKMGECRYLAEAWDQALAVYEQYLRDFPNAKNRAVALYHAGEAHYKIASARAAIENQTERIRFAYEAYRAAVAAAKTGPYACYAAFRLGSFSYNAAQKEPDRYKEAIRWFGIAAAQAPKSQPRIQVTSLFYLGRSQRYLKDNKAAAATFTDLTKIKEENIYFDQAWQELAQMDMEAGRTEEAMKKFQRLSRESVDAETRASSLVNAGMIHADAGRTEEAITNFEEALKVPGDKARSARARARFGLVWSSYKVKAHEKVVKAWRELQGEDGDLDEYSRARLWLIVGTSYAALDMHSPAARTLQLLENLINSPEKAVIEACQEGGYKRIVSLFKLNEPATVDAVDEYVRIWQERAPEVAWIDKAMLVKGAWYFNRSVWDHSSKAYKIVREGKLEKDKVATWLYQRGCAEASSGDKEAVATLTSFLEHNASDERAPMAQLQRALVRLKLDDLTNALSDFDEVAKGAAGTENGETAAYNAARVRGMKQDFPGMVAGFSKFLADYPKTRAAAEANYWIGTGSYQLQKYAECLAPLRTARSLDGKSYYQDGSLMIIAALAALQNVDALIPEVDAYLKLNMEKRISPDILRWLGMTLFRERKDYPKAARYLGFVVTFQEPEKTQPDIWVAHGECLLEIKDYAGAIAALDNYLKAEQRPQPRSRAYLLRGRSQFGAGKLDEAAKSVEEGLSIERENLIAAQLHMLSGDISAASSRLKEAISSYNTVRVTWEDPVLTPSATAKMIACLSKSTDASDLSEMEKLKKELGERFPKYQAPK